MVPHSTPLAVPVAVRPRPAFMRCAQLQPVSAAVMRRCPQEPHGAAHCPAEQRCASCRGTLACSLALSRPLAVASSHVRRHTPVLVLLPLSPGRLWRKKQARAWHVGLRGELAQRTRAGRPSGRLPAPHHLAVTAVPGRTVRGPKPALCAPRCTLTRQHMARSSAGTMGGHRRNSWRCEHASADYFGQAPSACWCHAGSG